MRIERQELAEAVSRMERLQKRATERGIAQRGYDFEFATVADLRAIMDDKIDAICAGYPASEKVEVTFNGR